MGVGPTTTFPSIVVGEPETAIKESAGPIEPGVAFTTQSVPPAAKAEVSTQNPNSMATKWNPMAIVAPSKKLSSLPQRNIIGTSIVFVVTRSGPKEEGSKFEDDDYNPLNANASRAK